MDMEDQLIKQLKTIRHAAGPINSDPAWVATNRAALLARIDQSAHAVESEVSFADAWMSIMNIFVPKRMLVLARHAFILFLAASVAVGGWIVSASASQESLPGEPLYQVKLAIEKTELTATEVVGSPTAVATKELDFAARRADEVKKSKYSDQKVVALRSLRNSIASTNERLDKAKDASSEQQIAVAKVVNERTEQILESLGKPATSVASGDATGTTALAGSAAVTQAVHETEKLVEATGVNAVKVLIANNTDASEVRATVENKLEHIAKDLTGIQADAQLAVGATTSPTGVPTTGLIVVPAIMVSVATTSGGLPVVALNLVTTTGTTPMTASTTANGRPDVSVVQERVDAAAVRIGEAKTLIEGNNLLGALEKVQELYGIKSEAKQAASQLSPSQPTEAPVVGMVIGGGSAATITITTTASVVAPVGITTTASTTVGNLLPLIPILQNSTPNVPNVPIEKGEKASR